ncbi:MAG: helix-turn-helix transcriptional regulator [Paraclostridium sp.]
MPNKLAGYRSMYKINQSTLAELLGIALPTYCNKENNKGAEFTRSEMVKLTKYFKNLMPNITMDEIFL